MKSTEPCLFHLQQDVSPPHSSKWNLACLAQENPGHTQWVASSIHSCQGPFPKLLKLSYIYLVFKYNYGKEKHFDSQQVSGG